MGSLRCGAMAQTERQWGEHQRVVQSSTVAGFDGSANTRESPAIRALMIVISDMSVGSGPPVALYHLAHTSSRQVINNRGLLLLDGVPDRILSFSKVIRLVVLMYVRFRLISR